MQLPDYHGGSIVNLMASLLSARGQPSSDAALYPQAARLRAAEIARARHLILLVIDGLGDQWLQRHRPMGWLAQHRISSLTSVFPPTTASAITTYLTGDAPQQHAMTGWFMWLQELGSVLAVLPGKPRHGGGAYAAAGIDPATLYEHRPLFSRISRAGVMISPRSIARTSYNLAHLGNAKLRSFRDLNGLCRQIVKAVRGASAPTTVYAYWPELDAIGHRCGIESPEALAHLDQIDRQLGRLHARLRGTDSMLLVCSDHGQLDAAPGDDIEVANLPGLEACLRIPLCGEPRAAYCYLRPNQRASFERLYSDRLEGQFRLHPSAELVDAGLFGLGPPHPHLIERVGDFTLIARDRAHIHHRLAHEKPFTQIGVHGGLSDEELRVPLCRADA